MNLINKYDRKTEKKLDSQNIRREAYGFFRKPEEKVDPVCCFCHGNIFGQSVRINNNVYHHNCYSESRNEKN